MCFVVLLTCCLPTWVSPAQQLLGACVCLCCCGWQCWLVVEHCRYCGVLGAFSLSVLSSGGVCGGTVSEVQGCGCACGVQPLALLTCMSRLHHASPVLLVLALSDCPFGIYAGWTAGPLASWHLKWAGWLRRLRLRGFPQRGPSAETSGFGLMGFWQQGSSQVVLHVHSCAQHMHAQV